MVEYKLLIDYGIKMVKFWMPKFRDKPKLATIVAKSQAKSIFKSILLYLVSIERESFAYSN